MAGGEGMVSTIGSPADFATACRAFAGRSHPSPAQCKRRKVRHAVRLNPSTP
jgi:hypothetical protein